MTLAQKLRRSGPVRAFLARASHGFPRGTRGEVSVPRFVLRPGGAQPVSNGNFVFVPDEADGGVLVRSVDFHSVHLHHIQQ